MVFFKSYISGLTAVCIGLSAFFLLLSCSKGAILMTGQPAPAFALTDISGKPIRVPEDVKGRITVIRFWASWCKSCAAEMPETDKVCKKYADKGLVILAVNIGQDKDEVARFAKGYNISYPLLLDPGQGVTKRYGVKSLPITFLLDRNGVIRQKILGEIDRHSFEEIVLEWLKKS